ncbi:MAG TPA: 16S rRNA (cytidine(1402)-2'-O)-methyltransferase [Limnochordales bacterium]
MCGSPIGNLQDVTLRLLEVLRGVDLVASEDTRRTLQLLSHFDIRKPLVSYHEHNARWQARRLVARMRQGEQVALVTDAGMPAISDPGAELVELAAREGIPVSVVPGPSAVTAALAVSGFPVPPFFVEGFLPRKGAQRRRRLAQLRELDCVLVFFEAPHRLAEALADMAQTLGERPAVVARELTKLHEAVYRASLPELARQAREQRWPVRGEFTVVVGPPAPLPEAG